MYQLMINRKNSKKGFTLVEVIVVLVILAILAAIMIPAMTGWIDKAREKAVVVEARTAYLAAQTLCSEAYGASASGSFTQPGSGSVIALAGLSGASVTYEAASNAAITSFTYTASNGKIAEWDPANGTWTVK